MCGHEHVHARVLEEGAQGRRRWFGLGGEGGERGEGVGVKLSRYLARYVGRGPSCELRGVSLPNKAQEEVGMDAQGYRPGCQLPCLYPPTAPLPPSYLSRTLRRRHPSPRGVRTTPLTPTIITHSSIRNPHKKGIVCHKVRIKGPLMHDKVCLPWGSWQFFVLLYLKAGTCHTLTLI